MFSPKIIPFLKKNCCWMFYHVKKFSTELPPKNTAVTILNASTNIGRHLALLLKQSPHIEELRLYDKDSIVCAIAEDLSHIDTKAQVRSFGGLEVMKHAVADANIVVSVGGNKSAPTETARELFEKNNEDVRKAAMHMIQFNPNGFFCIARPPVEALVPMVSEQYKKAGVYDARKIFGVTSTESMRVNSIVAKVAKENPHDVLCPIVGGISGECLVGVLSQTRPKGLRLQSSETHKLIGHAEDEVIKKYDAKEPLCLTPAIGIARFINTLLRAVKGDKNCVECCFVRQTGDIGSYLPYMTSIVRLSQYGVSSSHMPKITLEEELLLQNASATIKEFIELGEKSVTDRPQIIKEEEETNDPTVKPKET